MFHFVNIYKFAFKSKNFKWGRKDKQNKSSKSGKYFFLATDWLASETDECCNTAVAQRWEFPLSFLHNSYHCMYQTFVTSSTYLYIQPHSTAALCSYSRIANLRCHPKLHCHLNSNTLTFQGKVCPPILREALCSDFQSNLSRKECYLFTCMHLISITFHYSCIVTVLTRLVFMQKLLIMLEI